MTRRLRLVQSLSAIIVLGIAACSGGTPASDGEAPADDATPTAAAETAGETGGEAGGDSGGETGAGGEVDLCSVLTLDEVSEAVGVEVTEAVGATLGEGQYSCNFNTAEGMPVAGNTLTTEGAGIAPADFFESNATAEGAEQIPDLGDEAVLVGEETFPIVFVMTDGDLYAMSVLAENLDAEARRQASIDLARLSLDRLP